eukprot:scaffold13306_cov234-Alexandrium_tamarense.AAC.1
MFSNLSFNSTYVPRKFNRPLATWAYKQRGYCKQISEGDTTTPLTKEKYAQLESIGFDMSGDTSKVRLARREEKAKLAEVAWEEKFNELLQYKETFGDCNVRRTKDKDSPYAKLASWADLQIQDDFDTRFNQLIEYQREHGHTRVPLQQSWTVGKENARWNQQKRALDG